MAKQVTCRDPESSPNCLLSQDPGVQAPSALFLQDLKVWFSASSSLKPRSPQAPASPPSNPEVWAFSPLLLQDPGARGPEYTAGGCFHGN